jgi:hypothetical protein
VSKTVLWIVIGIASFVVVLLAVLTPTVIENDNDNQARSVRVVAPVPAPAPVPEPAPFPFRRDLPPDLRTCLQRQGFGFNAPGRLTLPDLGKLRGALEDCAGQPPSDGQLPFDG